MNNQNNFMIVQGENLDENQLLGKFVYYSLADVLVDKDDFTRICLSMNFPYAARRISVVDAFRNATGRVTRSITQNSHGSQEIFRIYCRDNMRDGQIYSRELVRETVGLSTNQYEKLANVCYDRDRDAMFCNIEQNDTTVDVPDAGRTDRRRRHHDIARLNIAVDQSRSMDNRQDLTKLCSQIGGSLFIQRPTFPQDFCQRVPGNTFLKHRIAVVLHRCDLVYERQMRVGHALQYAVNLCLCRIYSSPHCQQLAVLVPHQRYRRAVAQFHQRRAVLP